MKDNQERKIKEKIGMLLLERNHEEIPEIFLEEYINNEVDELMQSYYNIENILEKNIEMVEENIELDPNDEDFPYIVFPLLNDIYTYLLYPYTRYYASLESETKD